MARGNYDLKYILLDGDFFDKEKIFLIEEKHGFEGGYIAIRLLLWIAAKGGFGAEWNEETSPRYFAAKALGDKSKGELVAAVVSDLFGIGYFDRQALTESGLLTSPEIVKDWLRAYKQFNKREAPTDGLPEYVIRILSKTAGNAEEIPANAPQMREDCGEIAGECAANAPQMRGTAPQMPEKSPLEKKRKEKNIYIPPTARTREGAETGKRAQSGETGQNSEYTPEERQAAESKISLWNEITAGTGLEYTDLYPQEMLICRIIDRIRQGPPESAWRLVFKNALIEATEGRPGGKQFPWSLEAVFSKPENFNQLKTPIPKQQPAKPKAAIMGRPDRFGSDRPGFGKVGYYD